MDLDWEAELHSLAKLDRIFSPKRDPEKEVCGYLIEMLSIYILTIV